MPQARPFLAPGVEGQGDSLSPQPILVPLGDRAAYCEAAHERVMGVIHSARTRQQRLHAQTCHGAEAGDGDRKPSLDTWIYPLIQMRPFAIRTDELVTASLLTEAEHGARICLTTGYFNLTQAYMDLVLGTRAEYRILLASPEVNGFFGAKGIAGAIPAAYVHIERQFYHAVCRLGQQDRVQLQEYQHPGWTFHAKGMGPGALSTICAVPVCVPIHLCPYIRLVRPVVSASQDLSFTSGTGTILVFPEFGPLCQGHLPFIGPCFWVL